MHHFTVNESMFEKVNVQGTIHMMDEALRSGVEKFIHCSTVAAMGICRDVPATEETPCRPHHPYGKSKLKAEQEVLHRYYENGFPAVIVRLSMVYGPGDERDILRLARMAKKGLFPKIGRGLKLTPLIHVEDAVQGLLLAAEKGRPGQIYLLTNRLSEPFDKLRKIIQQALGVSRTVLYVPEWAALTLASISEGLFQFLGKAPPVTKKNIESTLADRVFSIEKASRELGFDPKVGVKEGLAETVVWYRMNGWV
jgi:nucleoside-diphosphate-sugar epimerase